MRRWWVLGLVTMLVAAGAFLTIPWHWPLDGPECASGGAAAFSGKTQTVVVGGAAVLDVGDGGAGLLGFGSYGGEDAVQVGTEIGGQRTTCIMKAGTVYAVGGVPVRLESVTSAPAWESLKGKTGLGSAQFTVPQG